MSRAILEGGFVYRSRVRTASGAVLAVLPTWSDGAIVKAARPDLLVDDGEWMGDAVHRAPDVTDRGSVEFLARLAASEVQS